MTSTEVLSLSPPSPDPDADPLSSSQPSSRPPPRKEASMRGVKPSGKKHIVIFVDNSLRQPFRNNFSTFLLFQGSGFEK